MPAGLLDTFNKEEIADLIAYLRAGGRASHPIYNKSVARQLTLVTECDFPRNQSSVHTQELFTMNRICLLALSRASCRPVAADERWLVFPGGNGPGAGKHIVLVSGDHEYRSEEAFPQLGKILSLHHGFKCTVLFPIDPETGEINPESVTNIPGLESLESADLMILGLRFRNLEDDQMKRIVDYAEVGKADDVPADFNASVQYPQGSSLRQIHLEQPGRIVPGGFGKQIFGETWVSHHGKHGHESTRGIVADAASPNRHGNQGWRYLGADGCLRCDASTQR